MKKKVLIDVGHGGSDPGASANGLIEKELNLKVALLMEQGMKVYENVEVILTRYGDVRLDPKARINKAKHFNPDLCVSIHHNAAVDNRARGAEVIHAHENQKDNILAKYILENLEKVGMPVKREFSKVNSRNEDYYYMIREIWDKDTDAIIVEPGFLTNKSDSDMLHDQMFLICEADAIVKAIAKYLGLELFKEKKEDALNWIQEAFVELQNHGVINSPEYWEGKLDQTITIGEVFALMANVLNRVL
jgi:N-acetylmuramoyl-L-alanine amidase